MRLFVATHNAHKMREIAQILPSFEVLSDDPEGVEETASDFAGNALIKVRAIAARHPGEWCLADDSGLEVAALDGVVGDVEYAAGVTVHALLPEEKAADFSARMVELSAGTFEAIELGEAFKAVPFR
jgi:inosine/xanthosine triphosphate pyrophosphatase family protein